MQRRASWLKYQAWIFGLSLKIYIDLKVDDKLEVYEIIEVERAL